MAKVKIYSTATCVYCQAEKAFLDQKGVAYDNVMVDRDENGLHEMLSLSGGMSAVPFTVVTDDAGQMIDQFVGFDQPRLSKALGL